MRPPGEVLIDLLLFLLQPALTFVLVVIAIIGCRYLRAIKLSLAAKPPAPPQFSKKK